MKTLGQIEFTPDSSVLETRFNADSMLSNRPAFYSTRNIESNTGEEDMIGSEIEEAHTRRHKCWLCCRSIVKKGAIFKLDTGVYHNGRRKFVPAWAVLLSYLVLVIVFIMAGFKF